MTGRPMTGELFRHKSTGRIIFVVSTHDRGGGLVEVVWSTGHTDRRQPPVSLEEFNAKVETMPDQPAPSWAITLTRPWAAMCVVGPKQVENRDWLPPPRLIGQRIAIHAGKRFDEADWQLAKELMASTGIEWWNDRKLQAMNSVEGAVVGTAVIGGVLDKDHPELGTRTDALTEPLAAASPWFFGPYGWLLVDRKVCAQPVKVRGFQKLWRLPAEAADEISRQTGEGL